MYSVKVNVLENATSSIRGFATVVFADSFKVNNIAIVENKENELFVSMPRYASKDEEYHDICNPFTKEFREELYGTILTTFDQASKGGENRAVVGEVENPELSYNVKVSPFEREGSNIRALGRIYIEDCFVINNVSLLQGKNGVFVAMPSYKTKQMDENGKSIYQDLCYPITKECREKLYGDIKSAYEGAKETKHDNVHAKENFTQKSVNQEQDVPFR